MTKEHRLFCEISPLAYTISTEKEIVKRHVRDILSPVKLAVTKSKDSLPALIIRHKSLIRRRLHNVNRQLQENKAVNLSLAAPKVSGILIKPGETFSFWKLVGRTSSAKGYREGLTIRSGAASSGIGGGMCQFTNLLHWMVLHTDLEIVEHHHHNHLDLFPDFKRQIPFGTGTSVVYNYLDYRFRNNTDKIYQILVWTDDEYLCGEVRASAPMNVKVHIREEQAYFYWKDGVPFRHNIILRQVVDKGTGNTVESRVLMENNAQVMYDAALIDPAMLRQPDAAPGETTTRTAVR